MIYFLLWLFGLAALFLAMGFASEMHNNTKLENTIKRKEKEIRELKDELYKAQFTVPSTEKTVKVVFMRGDKNV